MNMNDLLFHYVAMIFIRKDIMPPKKSEKKGKNAHQPAREKEVVVVVEKERDKVKARKPVKLMEVFPMFENKGKKPFIEVPLLKFEEWAGEFEFFPSFVNDDTKDSKVWLCDNSVPKQSKGYSSTLNSFHLDGPCLKTS